MRKILLFASAIALMTSCAETEFEQGEAPDLSKGISFQASVEEQGAGTRAEWIRGEKAFNMFWYAETDKINIFSINTKTGIGNATGFWAADKVVSYKATQSKGDGVFTALSDGNLLEFDADKKAKFIAIWPAVQSAPNTALITDLKTIGTGVDAVIAVKLPVIAAQEQATKTGSKDFATAGSKSVVERTFMYSKSGEIQSEHPYDAVGEKLALDFKRPLPIKVFRTEGYDQYATDFGKLKSVKLEMLGTPKADGSYESNAAIIDYGSDAWFNLGTEELVKNDGTTAFDPATATNAKSEITLSFPTAAAAGIEWSDDANAFMNINKVAASTVASQEYEVTYTFENITFTKTNVLTNNWPITEGAFIESGTILDINAEKYFVTNATIAGNDRSLIINEGTLTNILGTAQNTIKWAGAEVPFSEFGKIVSKVQLSTSELNLLKNFANLKNIELAKNTAIPAKTFTQTGLTSVNMSLVDDIAVDGFAQQTVLANVSLPSYKFPNTAITNLLLIKDQLVTLNMAGVERIGDLFPAAGITLQDFAKLTTVTVKPGLKIGTSSFSGCELLANVNFPVGVVGASVELVGSSAFAKCEKLESISISNTAIPVSSFEGCTALASINGANGKGIVPTTIYSNAFNGCEALVNMDLSAATKIQASAFKDCTALVGVAQPDRDNIKVLYVDAITDLSDNVFNGCTSLEYVSFKNAETVGTGFFTGCTTIKEIEFLKPFSSKTIASGSFGTSPDTNTKLFVKADQDGVVGNSLTLNNVKFDFKTIVISLNN